MPLQVELVAAERRVWSGEASRVVARTTEGDLGVLPGHAPLLGVLVDGVVSIAAEDGQKIAAVHGGFLSVANNKVSILAEQAELSHEIDVADARRRAEELRGIADPDDEQRAALAAAESQLRASETAR
ncbi:MAG: F0F1 ATP synthase subunit epsilon [Actinomycetes bacterium]